MVFAHKLLVGFTAIISFFSTAAQQPTPQINTARELFYANDTAAPIPTNAPKRDPNHSRPETASGPVDKPLYTGVRYSIFKLTAGNSIGVPADSIFHSGDQIQIAIETNGPGHLYVIALMASGAWTRVFPLGGESRSAVEGKHVYLLPSSKGTWRFDSTIGNEHLFLVFSREPMPELEPPAPAALPNSLKD